MKLIPILFSAPMVQALLDNIKSQTRRQLKVQPDDFDTYDDIALLYLDGKEYHIGDKPFRCPYGEPGDVLWVRETFYAWGNWVQAWDNEKGRLAWTFIDVTLDSDRVYQHDEPADDLRKKRVHDGPMGWWKRPALFMPYAACRIWLKVDEIRAEPLQDISTEDAIAEGVERKDGHYRDYLSGEFSIDETCTITGRGFSNVPAAIWSYMTLWESINGIGSWKANPYVWPVSFTPTTKPQ